MTDAPETREDVYYYVSGSNGLRYMTRTLSGDEEILETWYRKDLAEARIAAAEAAMAKQAADLVAEDYVADAILALVPSDGQSALDQVIAEAVKREREACAQALLHSIPADAHPDSHIVWVLQDRAAAIRERGNNEPQ